MSTKTFKTDGEVKALQLAGGRAYDVADENTAKTDRLYLTIGKLNKSWTIRARPPGAPGATRLVLGLYPNLGLKAARDRAAEWRRLLRDGIDPRDARRQREATAKKQRKDLFGALVEDFLATPSFKARRRGRGVERRLRRECKSLWDRPVALIMQDDLEANVKRVRDRPAPSSARNLIDALKALYLWGCNEKRVAVNVAAPISPKGLLGQKRKRKVILEQDEHIAALWLAARALPYPNGPTWALLLLTGARRAEIAGMRQSELPPRLVQVMDELRGVPWGDALAVLSAVPQELRRMTVPPARFKKDRAHIIPLTPTACAVLAGVRHLKGTGDHVFSTTGGKVAAQHGSRQKTALDLEMQKTLRGELPEFTAHDIRRTVRTRLAMDKQTSYQTAELIIGHQLGGLHDVYDQHDRMQERHEALERWAAFVTIGNMK